MQRFNAKLKYIGYLNLSEPLKCQTVLTPIRSGQNVGPDLGPNCLKGLLRDDNVMFKLNEKLKYIISTLLVITFKVSNSFDTYQVLTECGA